MDKTEIELREKRGRVASIVGIVANTLLAASKIVVGLMFGFLSVLADGLNNLSDSGSSVVSLVSFKYSSKPADKEHPYGHQRIEYVASMAVAFFILLIAFELAKESIIKIISPEVLEFSFVLIVVLAASIAVKAAMFVYYRAVAKNINSDVLKASATDSLSDCVATSAVLVSVLVERFASVNIDGYIGVLVAIFIAFSGFGVLKETISKLIGQAPDKELIVGIKERILAHKEVLGIHDLNVYSYGPNKYFASVHIELDANLDPLVAHEFIDEIEREFVEQTNILLTGHNDPIVVNDKEVNSVRRKVSAMVKKIDGGYSMHDFRMVKGQNHTNVIFEVAIPFDAKHSEKQIEEMLKEEIAKIDTKYRPVIMVEKTNII